MRKLVIWLWIIGSLASAHAWSSRDANSAVCVAWESPGVLWGSPTAAEESEPLLVENVVGAGRDRGVERMLSGAPEESKVFSEESVPAGRGRGLVQMLSGAVLLFLIGGMPVMRAGMVRFRSFWAGDLFVADGEEDEQPITESQLIGIFEQEVALPDRLPEPEPGFDQDSMDRLHAWNRRTIARQKIWIEWLGEQLAVLGVEEYDPAPIPYCQRSPCYEGPGFEVPLSDIDSDSDSDADY